MRFGIGVAASIPSPSNGPSEKTSSVARGAGRLIRVGMGVGSTSSSWESRDGVDSLRERSMVISCVNAIDSPSSSSSSTGTAFFLPLGAALFGFTGVSSSSSSSSSSVATESCVILRLRRLGPDAARAGAAFALDVRRVVLAGASSTSLALLETSEGAGDGDGLRCRVDVALTARDDRRGGIVKTVCKLMYYYVVNNEVV